MTSTDIALARMLVAYAAWQPGETARDALLYLIGDLLDDFGLLEANADGVFGPNAEARALIQRVRDAGLLDLAGGAS